MRYTLKQKFWSLGDSFTIEDAGGKTAFKVTGKLLSIGDKLTVSDAGGTEVARIEQKLISLRPVYQIKRSGKVIATVKKKLFTVLRDKFIIDVPGPDDLEAAGSIMDHEYTMTCGSDTVATVSRKWIRLTDTYTVDIADGADPLLALCSAVIIDLICHRGEETS